MASTPRRCLGVPWALLSSHKPFTSKGSLTSAALRLLRRRLTHTSRPRHFAHLFFYRHYSLKFDVCGCLQPRRLASVIIFFARSARTRWKAIGDALNESSAIGRQVDPELSALSLAPATGAAAPLGGEEVQSSNARDLSSPIDRSGQERLGFTPHASVQIMSALADVPVDPVVGREAAQCWQYSREH